MAGPGSCCGCRSGGSRQRWPARRPGVQVGCSSPAWGAHISCAHHHPPGLWDRWLNVVCVHIEKHMEFSCGGLPGGETTFDIERTRVVSLFPTPPGFLVQLSRSLCKAPSVLLPASASQPAVFLPASPVLRMCERCCSMSALPLQVCFA